MHIVLAVLGILSAIGFFIYRARMAADGAREVADMAKTVVNLPRRLTFLRKSGKSGLSLVEDPRDAAAVMMVEIARADGEITTTQRAAIVEQLTDRLDMRPDEAEETYVNAAWISRDAPSSEKVMVTMMQTVCKSDFIGDAEVEQLHASLLHVASTDSPPSERQVSLLEIARDKDRSRVA